MKIDDNTLTGMRVNILNLSSNNIRRVPSLALRKATRVGELVLDNNLFRTLERGAIHNVKGRPSYI